MSSFTFALFIYLFDFLKTFTQFLSFSMGNLYDFLFSVTILFSVNISNMFSFHCYH